MGKLTALKVQRTTEPGFYPDGDGLYLQVTGAQARSWVFRFTLHGRQRYLGLGSASAISLGAARELAAEARLQKTKGVDPVNFRREERTAQRVATLRELTFKQAAERLIDAHEATWRNAKHRQQWTNTLKTYAFPVIGNLPVQDVDTALVVKALSPIWATKTETASRVRGRIEQVLDWATVAGHRQGDNPARWRGHLVHLLAKPSKVRRVKHHAALPYDELPAFMADLRSRKSTSAKALELTILTALRTSEVIGARWSEVNFAEKVWTVPGSRMKAGKDHRIPLSPRMLAILGDLQQRRGDGDHVVPGGRTGRGLSNMAMLKMLGLMGRGDLTVHGFRSAFRDWAAERTNFPNHVAEMALAHSVADKVEAAYRRGDLFEKRARLMQEWDRYCSSRPAGAKDTAGDKVVELRAARD